MEYKPECTCSDGIECFDCAVGFNKKVDELTELRQENERLKAELKESQRAHRVMCLRARVDEVAEKDKVIDILAQECEDWVDVTFPTFPTYTTAEGAKQWAEQKAKESQG